jgi:NAD(P)-dependent dehydrogenase (short-subunit alcohol dehydrogenase family)
MSPPGIVLILGSGPRVGASVAAKFASDGYKVAIASRKGLDSNTPEGYVSLKVDFTKPEDVPALFLAVKDQFGSFPNVVVYNAATLTPPKESILSVPAFDILKDFQVNTVSPYVAANEAVKGWATLPNELQKIFIYTGNASSEVILPIPMTLTLSLGKRASSYWVGAADGAFAEKGYRSAMRRSCMNTQADGDTDSFMLMSAMRMAQSKAWPLMVLRMLNSL